MTGKTIEQMAEELLLRIDDHADIFVSTAGPIRDMILAALRSVESDTREACAKTAEKLKGDAPLSFSDSEEDGNISRGWNWAVESIAQAIRSQGDTQ